MAERQTTSSTWRLPRETGDLLGDWLRARHAAATATTDEQRAAVQLRMESLTARSDEALRPSVEAVKAAMEQMREAFDHVGRVWAEALRRAFPELVRAEQARRQHADVPARALLARQARNTGPERRPRPPRRIDPRGTR